MRFNNPLFDDLYGNAAAVIMTEFAFIYGNAAVEYRKTCFRHFVPWEE